MTKIAATILIMLATPAAAQFSTDPDRVQQRQNQQIQRELRSQRQQLNDLEERTRELRRDQLYRELTPERVRRCGLGSYC